MVDEKVLPALIRSNEAVAFLLVEPLDRSLRHPRAPPFSSSGFVAAKPFSTFLRPQYTRHSSLQVCVWGCNGKSRYTFVQYLYDPEMYRSHRSRPKRG